MQKAHNNVDWKNWPDISTPLSQSNLNAMDQSIDVIDDRVIVLDTTKANQSDLLTAVARLEFDDETGILTIYYKNGLTDTIDTGLAKLTMNWDYDNDPTSEHYQDLVLEMADGTYKYVDLSALINNHEFADTSTINFTITNGVVSADVIDGSITDQKLETNYLANITTQANHAAQAASAAATSESNASDSADDAEDSALVSEGWAVGKQNGVDVEVGSDYYENNSKYYKEQAEASATSAAGSATSASLSAGSAQNAFVGASEIQTDVTNMRNAVRTWQQDVQQNATSVASNTATAQTASNTAVNASNAAVAANSSAQSAATRAEAAADRAEEIVDISVMTPTRNGIGKPDGVTITVDANGTFSAAAGVTLQFVDTLPPIGTAIESVIYCLKTQSTGSDIYEEYVVGYDEQEQREWVQIGDTSVNLSGYATEYYVDTAKNQVQGNLTTHVNTAISTENGVHGIRFYNNKLQRWVPNAWLDIETGGNITIINPTGTEMTPRSKVQFTGNVTVTDDSTNNKTVVNVQGPQIQNANGINVTKRSSIQFGGDLQVTDDAQHDRTIVSFNRGNDPVVWLQYTLTRSYSAGSTINIDLDQLVADIEAMYQGTIQFGYLTTIFYPVMIAHSDLLQATTEWIDATKNCTFTISESSGVVLSHHLLISVDATLAPYCVVREDRESAWVNISCGFISGY